MIINAYSIMGPFYSVIDVESGEKIKGVQYVNSKTGELLVLKPNKDPKNPDEYSKDKSGKYETIEVKRKVKLVRNTSWIKILYYLIKDLF